MVPNTIRRLALAPLVLLLVPGAMAAATGTDGFEGGTVGLQPTSQFYTLAGTCGGDAGILSTATANAGAKSFVAQGGSDNCRLVLNADMCDSPNMQVTFSARFPSLPAAATTYKIIVGTSTGFQFNPDGTVQAIYSDVGGAPVVNGLVPAATFAANVWFTASVTSGDRGSDGDACTEQSTPGTAKWRFTFGASEVKTREPKLTSATVLQCSPCASTTYFDDVTVSGAAQPFTSASSYVVPGTTITGFDGHPFQSIAIARYANQNVATFDPTNLALGPLATEATPNCGTIGGVMAYQRASGSVFVAYTNCLSGGNAEKLKIRNSVLSEPDVSGTACAANGGLCGDYTLATAEGVILVNECVGQSTHAFPPNLADIGNIQAIPISYERSAIYNDGWTPDKVSVGFAYINTAATAAAGGGRFGVWVHTRHESGSHVSCGLEVGFTSPGQQTQLCTWRDPLDGKDYALAASLGGGSAVYRLDIDVRAGATLADYGPVVTITQVAALPSPWGKLQAVDCGGRGLGADFTSSRDVIVQNDLGHVYRLTVLGGPVVAKWGPVIGTATYRGVTMSGDGKWFSYLSGTSLIVGNASSGRASAIMTVPAGSWRGAQMHDTGQSLLTATTTRLDRFDVYEGTTGVPVAAGTRCNPITGNCTTQGPDGTPVEDLADPTPATGVVQGSLTFCGIASIVTLGGLSEEDSCFLAGLTITIGFAGLGFFLGRKRGQAGIPAAAGANLGYFVATYVAGFPMWPITAFIVVLALFVYWRRR